MLCIHCASPVSDLVSVEQNKKSLVLAKCPQCGLPCDPCVENVPVQVALDIILLKPHAWTHMMYNSPRYLFHIVLGLVLVSVVLEVYVSTYLDLHSTLLLFHTRSLDLETASAVVAAGSSSSSTSAAMAAGGLHEGHSRLWEMLSGGGGDASSAAADWMDVVHNPTLNVVTNFKSPLRRGLLLRLEPLRIAESCVYGVFEYLLITVVAAWCGSWFGASIKSASASQGSVLLHWVLGIGLVWSAKLSYLFFLIWNVPLYLVIVVDALSILWLFQAVATALRVGRMAVERNTALVEDWAPFKGRALLITVVVIGTRFLYRSFTTWNSLFLTADLLMDVLE